MLKNTIRSLLMLIVMTVLLGIIYPFLITGISTLFFNNKANGSLVKIDNKIIGSKLLGQKFTSGKYFW
jgi:potassium-transporting ATPase KdpC subunit